MKQKQAKVVSNRVGVIQMYAEPDKHSRFVDHPLKPGSTFLDRLFTIFISSLELHQPFPASGDFENIKFYDQVQAFLHFEWKMTN